MDSGAGATSRARRTRRLSRGIGVALALMTLLLLGTPARPAAAAVDESISTYDTRIEVRPDGAIRVNETIGYDFGDNTRHGIIRKIPASFRYDDTRDRVYIVDEVAVTMDGTDVPVERSSQGGYQILKIGDPAGTVTGSHTYAIGYTVRGTLNSFPDHEELYWNAVGGEWDVPIRSATVVVTSPVAIERVECFAGPTGSRLGCATKSVHGPTAMFQQGPMAAGSGLSVVVALPPKSVSNTGPILTNRHDLTAAFRVTPATAAGAVALALIGGADALAIAWRTGRDRRYVGLLPGLTPERGEVATEERKPLIGAPPVSVEFTPPERVGRDGRRIRVRPGQVGTLIDERANVLDVTATIGDFGVRRHLFIRELPAAHPQDWELTKLGTGDRGFLPYERTLFDALFADRDRVRLSELKNTFATDLHKVQRQLYADMVEEGWYRQSPARTRAVARAIATLILLGAIGATILLALLTQAALVGLGLVVGALVLLVAAGSFPARTGRGSATLARVQGFRLYVATTEAEQIKFQEREKIFSEYLPYAIVFGLADRWAGIFADIGSFPTSTAPDGTTGLYWYAGAATFSLATFHQSIGSFATATVGTIATTPPSAAGASGFSGGGFAGGGAGGGGGGSW